MRAILALLLLLLNSVIYGQGSTHPINSINNPVVNNDPYNIVSCDPVPNGLWRMNIKDSVQWNTYNIIGLEAEIQSVGDIRYPKLIDLVGTISFFGGSSAPTGYLMCDGSAISRTTYSDLFAIVSTVYGVGDGSTTFNLPDLRQRFPLTKAVSGTGSTLGGTGGAIDHVHTVDPPSTVSGVPSSTSQATALGPQVGSSTHTHTLDISVFNSGTANAPFLVLNSIIKY